MTDGGLATSGWLLGLDCWLFTSSGGSGWRFLCKRFDAQLAESRQPFESSERKAIDSAQRKVEI